MGFRDADGNIPESVRAANFMTKAAAEVCIACCSHGGMAFAETEFHAGE